jgi:hypothetical protein
MARDDRLAAELADLNETSLNVLIEAATRARFKLADFVDCEVTAAKAVLNAELILGHDRPSPSVPRANQRYTKKYSQVHAIIEG